VDLGKGKAFVSIVNKIRHPTQTVKGKSAQTEAAGMNLQTDEAKAMAVEITAGNDALEEAYQSAEAQAEATTEQANQMAQAMEDVLEELQEMEERAEQASPAAHGEPGREG
jgi:methyl-accepting chemotaxis protein